MNRFLLLWAPAAALGLIIGCAGEEGADVGAPPSSTPIPPPESPTPPPAVDAEAPDLTPPAEVDAQATTPDLTPAEAHKAEEANHPEGAEAKPAGEPKKDEAPLTPPQAEEPKAEAPKDEPKKDEPKAEAATPSLEGPGAASAALSDEEVAEIKKLPAEDHDLALAQAVCPVSDENLGSMDVPLKVSAEGRDFFICCKGCEKKVKSDPKGVLAKLDGEKK